jgi:hypothetical protein
MSARRRAADGAARGYQGGWTSARAGTREGGGTAPGRGRHTAGLPSLPPRAFRCSPRSLASSTTLAADVCHSRHSGRWGTVRRLDSGGWFSARVEGLGRPGTRRQKVTDHASFRWTRNLWVLMPGVHPSDRFVGWRHTMTPAAPGPVKDRPRSDLWGRCGEYSSNIYHL